MIILTNDDGIDAPGLAALESAIAGQDAITVAPLHMMSECSHRVTTKTALRIEPRSKGPTGIRRFAVDGTPADCVRVALLHLLPDLKIPLDNLSVYSGINMGGNLGADIYISGTVAAVREAAFFGIPGIAFSQYRRALPDDAHWSRAAQWTRRTLQKLRTETLAPGEFWNVNFPWPQNDATDSARITFCDRSRRPLPVQYETLAGNTEDARQIQYIAGLYHAREFEPGSDIDVCFNGNISVTRIAI